jgi:hypothetical protein
LKLVTKAATRSPSKRSNAPVDSSISRSFAVPVLTVIAMTSVGSALKR